MLNLSCCSGKELGGDGERNLTRTCNFKEDVIVSLANIQLELGCLCQFCCCFKEIVDIN